MPCRLALLIAAALSASCGVVAPSAENLRRDPQGHLIWAARRGDVSAIRTLAASGLDVNASRRVALKFVFPDVDHAGSLALKHAVWNHQAEAGRALPERGAAPDATVPG